uniref:RNA-directed RNA polymerase n=1 Tax=Leviviridae sp. TaxID=2027243 RepID=A0A514D2I2_9VIRU|nr:MAG: RNA-dependent RNA polymerase [Leviviridae sp.]
MKSLISLWSQVAEESATRCCTSATLDINTVKRRVKHEGYSFLTITLPDFGKAIQKWLDHGQVDPVSAFRSRQGLPLFLGGFLDRVFDRNSGVLLTDPCVDSIHALRQLTLMFGKIALPCSDARVRKAMREFVECEQDVRRADSKLSRKQLENFKQMSTLLFRNVFLSMERDLYAGALLPKHGPGAVAEKLSSNGKYRSTSWTRRLEGSFPASEYLIPNSRFSRELDQVTILEPGAEVPVRVTPVPKTLKTPRIIAIEPTCMQYMQQALKRSFLEHFSKDDLLTSLIGFDDQTPNQRMACQGSIDNRTATLDLSEASDRVSNQLVRTMLRDFPLLQGAVDASRSRLAVMDDGTVIRLAKYASMGSALCFPMEALVFTTLIFLGIQESLNTSLTREDVKSFSSSVRVYGDDLIVPADHVLTVVSALEHFGAKVGLDKSFWTGRFRESCGREYYAGSDISIVRVRQLLPGTTADVREVIASVALRNQLYMSGYWQTARWLDNRLRKVLKHFPDVEPTSPLLGRVSLLGYQAERVDPNLHAPLVKGYRVEANPPSDELEGYGALLKCLLRMESGDVDKVGGRHVASFPYPGTPPQISLDGWSDSWAPPASDTEHLERSGRPKRVNIKLRWCTPY